MKMMRRRKIVAALNATMVEQVGSEKRAPQASSFQRWFFIRLLFYGPHFMRDTKEKELFTCPCQNRFTKRHHLGCL